MRRFVVISLFLALAAAPAADAGVARYLSASGDRLALRNGKGVAKLVSRDGVAWGKVRVGRISVTDLVDESGTEIHVWGADRKVVRANGTTVYINTRDVMTFEIVDGRWRAVIRGRAINASVVMVGRVVLSYGRSGTYQVNFGARKRWPWAPKLLILE